MPSSLPSELPPAIEINGLTRRFGSLVAVDHIELIIPQGEIFGLLGANGAGKTTLIKMLTTLLPPSSGAAEVGGFEVVSAPAEVRRRIGYVPQMVSADGALTALENLQLSAKLYGLPRAERETRIPEVIDFMGLAKAERRLVKTYSGGMIRKLELAQAMLHRPQVLFLDEPSIGLDPVARRMVWDRLLDLRVHYNITVLITTHDMEEAEILCDELAIMHGGHIAVVGKPAELRVQLGPSATLSDVFAHYAGESMSESGNLAGTAQARSTARRLG
jgi:ABC-2 type transport system ATP-binding protein